MRPDEARLGTAPGFDGRLRKAIGQSQVGQPHRAVGRPHEQVGVGCQVGVDTQRCAANDDSNVVAVVGRREFSCDQSTQSS